jgi:membrane protease YdiL (CAAX protease family)
VTSIKAHHHLLIFLFLALGFTCLLAPWMALGADWAAARWPQMLDERVPFGRVFNRAFMVAGVILFFLMRRQIVEGGTIKRLLALPARAALRNLLVGFGLALGSMALLLAVMIAADVYTPFFRLPLETSLERLASALATGFLAGTLEEIFFRGILFVGVLRNTGRWQAYLFVNLFYSALHFVKPGREYFLDRWDLFAGFRHLLTTFAPFIDPPTLIPGLIGLFLIGAVLSYAVERTGNLHLSIGLHAGWIVAIRSVRIVGDFSRRELGWAFGATDPKIVSGVVTWLVVLLVAVAIVRLTRLGAILAADPSRQRAP